MPGNGCFAMTPVTTATSQESTRPKSLIEDPPTLLHLRPHARAQSKDSITTEDEVTSDSQTSFDTATGMSSAETMDTRRTTTIVEDTSDAETMDKRSQTAATFEDIFVKIKIVGAEIVDGVLYYRLHTPTSRDMVASVLRSYSEFVKLDSALAASRHSRQAVPLTRGFLPRAEVVGFRRSLNEEKFLQSRQDMLQKYLNVIAAQWPVSSQDQCVQDFLHRGASHEAAPEDVEQVLPRPMTMGDRISWFLLKAQASVGC